MSPFASRPPPQIIKVFPHHKQRPALLRSKNSFDGCPFFFLLSVSPLENEDLYLLCTSLGCMCNFPLLFFPSSHLFSSCLGLLGPEPRQIDILLIVIRYDQGSLFFFEIGPFPPFPPRPHPPFCNLIPFSSDTCV